MVVYFGVSSGIVCNTLVLWKKYFKCYPHSKNLLQILFYKRFSLVTCVKACL